MSERKRSIIVIAAVSALMVTGIVVLVHFFDDEYKGDPYSQEDIDSAWDSVVVMNAMVRLTSISTPHTVTTIQFNGTGLVIDHDGLKVLTNAHVVGVYEGQVLSIYDKTTKTTKEYDTKNYTVESISIICVFMNGDEHEMEMTHSDFKVDLALLAFVDEAPEVTPLKLGDSSTLLKNQPVFTIGNSEGKGLKLSEGLVENQSTVRSWIPGYTMKCVMAALEIYHGNSGGPLITVGGEVVGVVSAGYATDESDASPMTFAIPSNTVKKFLSSIPADADNVVGTSFSSYVVGPCVPAAC